MRCFCPPESVIPRSPTIVSKPFGKSRTSFASCATPAAHSARGPASAGAVTPNATFSRTVSEKRNVSCGTKPTAPRSVASGSRRMSWPSTNTRAGRGVVEAREQRHERALAGAGRPDDRDRGCPPAPEVDVVQHGRAVVGEGQAAELDVAADLGHGLERRLVADLGRRVEHLGDAPHRGLAPLEDVDHPAEGDHRPVEHREVRPEGDELAEA